MRLCSAPVNIRVPDVSSATKFLLNLTKNILKLGLDGQVGMIMIGPKVFKGGRSSGTKLEITDVEEHIFRSQV